MMLDRMEGNAELKSSVQLMLPGEQTLSVCSRWSQPAPPKGELYSC